MVDPCKPGTGPMDYIKVREFMDYLSDYKLLKKDCVAWNHFAYIRHF